jgi:very-short-patch-repair endonuclease
MVYERLSMMQRKPPYLVELARAQRQRATSSTQLIWEAVRNRRLNNAKFVREKIIGRYIIDFYCRERSLVLEIDGSVHDTPEAMNYDLARDAWLRAQGYRVMRVRNEEVIANMPAVLERVRAVLSSPPVYPPLS